MRGRRLSMQKYSPARSPRNTKKHCLAKKSLLPQPRELFLMQISLMRLISLKSNHLSVKFALARRVWVNSYIIV